MKRRTISMHSKIVGYLLTGILFTGCVTAKETQLLNSEIKTESNRTNTENLQKKSLTNSELEKLNQFDTRQGEKIKLDDYAIYFTAVNGCDKMYYLFNKSKESSLTINLLKKSSNSSESITYTIAPQQSIQLGCSIDENGNNVTFQVIK